MANTVEILIKSRDEAAPDMDALKARLEELGHEVATARAEVDDADAAAKLDRLQAKLLDLDRRVANPKIRMSGAIRAEADIHAIEASMDNLARKEDEAVAKAGTEGLISRILGGVGGTVPDAIPLIGGAGPAGLAGIGAALAALLPEVVAVGSGFAAAGAGAVSFGALAMPAVKNVENAYTGLGAAQDKLTAAQQKYTADPTKANARALSEAKQNVDLVNDSLKKLPASEQDAVKGVQGLASEFGKLSRAFEPTAYKVFAGILQVAHNLLPAVMPMANAFAGAITGLLKQLNGFTQSSGFQNWLREFTSLIGPAVTAIGQGAGQVAIQFGKLLTVFSGSDVANGINIAFGAIKLAIQGVVLAVEGLKSAWDKLSQNATFKRIAGEFQQAWDAINTTGKKKPDFSALVKAVEDAVSTGVKFLNTKLAPEVNTALKAANRWLSANAGDVLVPIGKAVMQGLLKGLESQMPNLLEFLGKVAVTISEHKGPIEKDRLLLVPHGQAIMAGLMDGIASRVPDLRGQLDGITSSVGASAMARTGPGYAAPAAAAAGQLAIQFQLGSGGSGIDQLFMTWLKGAVRAGGGDPRIFTKKVAFL